MLSTCKLPDTLVGLTVDDRLVVLLVIDGPPVFPKLFIMLLQTSQRFQVSACSMYVLLYACKLRDPLVASTVVDDPLGGLVVEDSPHVFPKFMNNGVSIIRESDFRYQHAVYLCFAFSMQVT